jgi:hypothetical protein
MTQPILTLGDLQHAEAKEIKKIFSKVTVKEDLETYLRWLSDNEITTTVTSQLKRKRKRALGIHPSSASKKGVCNLKILYECTGEIEPFRAYDPDMQQIWDQGTLLHDTYQVHFNSMYDDQFQDEVKLKNEELHIYSASDGLFTFTDVRFILEMKSIKEGGNFGWAKVQSKPMDDHVRQAHFYMWLADVPFGLIFYIGKNNGQFKEHAIMFDDSLWAEIMNDVVWPVSEAAYNNGDMVDAKPGWHCKWCDFHHSCEAARRHKTHVKGSKSASWGKTRR